MECLGGNGYVEDGTLARLYREAPVNAIWEGSGNVMCLDVLRAFARDAEAARATLADLARRSGRSARRGGCRESDRKDFRRRRGRRPARALPSNGSRSSRRPRRSMRRARGDVAETFARTRLSGRRGATYGTSDLAAAETGRCLRECCRILEPAHPVPRLRRIFCALTRSCSRLSSDMFGNRGGQEPRASKQRC